MLGLVYLSQKGDSSDSQQKKFEKIEGILTFIRKIASENFIPELLFIFSEWLCTQFMLHHRQQVILDLVLNFHISFIAHGLSTHIKTYFSKICANFIPTELAYLFLFATNINKLLAKYQTPPSTLPSPPFPLTFYCKFCGYTNEFLGDAYQNNCTKCGIKCVQIWSLEKFDRQKFAHPHEGDINGDAESGADFRGGIGAVLRESLGVFGGVKGGLVGEMGVGEWWCGDLGGWVVDWGLLGDQEKRMEFYRGVLVKRLFDLVSVEIGGGG